MALGKRPLASNTAGSDVSFSRVGDVSTPNFQALYSSHAHKFAHEAISRPFFNHFLMSASTRCRPTLFVVTRNAVSFSAAFSFLHKRE
jgi:hypothetical protein